MKILIDVRLPKSRRTQNASLSAAKRIDEALISTVRAAGSRGIEIVMPDDEVFGSLAALVLTEFAAKRDAERVGGEEPPRTWMSFFSHGRSSKREWLELLSEQGLTPVDVAAPDIHTALDAAVLLGAAPVAGSLAAEVVRQRTTLPVFAFRSCGVTDGLRERVRFVDDEIDGMLSELRPQRQDLAGDGSAGEVAPAERSTFAPYALYAQKLIDEILRGGQSGEPEPSPTTPRSPVPTLARRSRSALG